MIPLLLGVIGQGRNVIDESSALFGDVGVFDPDDRCILPDSSLHSCAKVCQCVDAVCASSYNVIGPSGSYPRTLALSVGLIGLMEEYDIDPVLGLLELARVNEIEFGS